MKRFTNLTLAALLGLSFASGLLAQGLATGWARSVTVVHGALGLSFLLLIPWKRLVVATGLRRRRSGSAWSIVLAVAVVVTIASGIVQVTGLVRSIGPFGMMQVHIGAAVVAIVLTVAHYLRHPVRPRATDLGKRNLLRLATLGTGAGMTWLVWEGAGRAAGLPGAERRSTGSHERGSGDPAAMPVTQWFTDDVPRDARVRLTVRGRNLESADIAALPLEMVEATLDCTSGWYSTQTWRGVRLDQLLGEVAAPSIEVRSVTGYGRRFPASDADTLWLAFEVGGAPLSAGHGFPARLVAPGRRGFWWVKWVESIELSDVPAWFQWPFPLS